LAFSDEQSMQPDSLFQAVVETFAELGASDPDSISRTLLLRDRQFVSAAPRCLPIGPTIPQDVPKV